MSDSTNPYQTPESEGSLPVEDLGEPTPGAAAIVVVAIVLGTVLNESVVFWSVFGHYSFWSLMEQFSFSIWLWSGLIPVGIGLGVSGIAGQLVRFQSKRIAAWKLSAAIVGPALVFLALSQFDQSEGPIVFLSIVLAIIQGVLSGCCTRAHVGSRVRLAVFATLSFGLGCAAGIFHIMVDSLRV